MKVNELMPPQWQEMLEEFLRDNPDAKPAAAFRIDGTQFSVGRFYGGFTYNGSKYTVFGYDWQGEYKGALIGVRDDLLKWVTKRCKNIKESMDAELNMTQPRQGELSI